MKVKSFRHLSTGDGRRFMRRKKSRETEKGDAQVPVAVENPEVGARLTNLSLRHAGMRPAWFDIEPVALPGRTRQCHRIFWQIMTAMRHGEKQKIVLHASHGMGKTTFLAQLYAMLEHAPETILTLAPGRAGRTPFQAVRNILEQRFYVSGEASFECIERFVKGGVEAIVPGEDARRVSADLLELWSSPHALESGSGAPEHRVVPPPLATRVVALSSVMNEGQANDRESLVSSGQGEPLIVPGEAVGEHGTTSEVSCEIVVNEVENLSSVDISLEEMVAESEPTGAGFVEIAGTLSSPAPPIMPASNTIKVSATLPGLGNTARPDASERTRIGIRPSSPESHDAEPLSQSEPPTPPPPPAEQPTFMSRLECALRRFMTEDLKRNAIVIIFDDVEKFDHESLELLTRVFKTLGEARLTMLLTTSDTQWLESQGEPFAKLEPMSDTDLMILTRNAIRTMSQSRENCIVPQEVCRQIAQHAYGSPRNAMDMAVKFFPPDRIMQWSQSLETLRRQSLPTDIGHSIVKRFRARGEDERFVLQVASLFNAPFTSSALQCAADAVAREGLAPNVSCPDVARKLRHDGFFDRAEETYAMPAATYVFKHDCERLVISGSVDRAVRRVVYGAAAQWFALHNTDHAFDELIGDLWRSHRSPGEACRYYERAAQRASADGLALRAWTVLNKWLGCLESEQTERRIEVLLKSAHVGFRMGHTDKAFERCREARTLALEVSAYPQVARAEIIKSAMLVEQGNVRHVPRILHQARAWLNRQGDAHVLLELECVAAEYALTRAKYREAQDVIMRARALTRDLRLPKDDECVLTLDVMAARIEANIGRPLDAVSALQHVIERARNAGHIRMVAHHALGTLYASIDNLALALESWNVALGLAQEMHNVVFHAKLLADIAGGAIALDARRTARAVLEQCSALAQQTRQRPIIARCLAYTAHIQIIHGQFDRAMRTLRKAHKSASALQSMPLWAHTLSLMAWLYGLEHGNYYRPAEANRIYKKLFTVYSRYAMHLMRARLMPQYAQFLCQTHQNIAALNACRTARSLYRDMKLDKGCDKMQAIIDALLRESSLEKE